FALRNLLSPRVLFGATAVGRGGGAQEIEDGPAVSLFAASVPDARLTPVSLDLEMTGASEYAITGWPELDHEPSTFLLCADPFTFPTDAFLRRLEDARPGMQVIGGGPGAAHTDGGNRLLLVRGGPGDGAGGGLGGGGGGAVVV